MNRRARCLAAALALLALPAAVTWSAPARGHAEPAPRPHATPPLAPLSFLLGSWDAAGGGQPGRSEGVFTFALEADGHAILRRNESRSPEGTHRDVLLVYEEGGALRATYVDGEGHVIHYDVFAPGGDRVAFLSDSAAAGPRFRLSYRRERDGSLASRFEIRPPGAAEFGTYLAGTARPAASSPRW